MSSVQLTLGQRGKRGHQQPCGLKLKTCKLCFYCSGFVEPEEGAGLGWSSESDVLSLLPTSVSTGAVNPDPDPSWRKTEKYVDNHRARPDSQRHSRTHHAGSQVPLPAGEWAGGHSCRLQSVIASTSKRQCRVNKSIVPCFTVATHSLAAGAPVRHWPDAVYHMPHSFQLNGTQRAVLPG